MRAISKCLVAFSVSMIGSAIMTSAGSAGANWRRINSNGCQVTAAYGPSAPARTSGGVLYNNGYGSGSNFAYSCLVPDDTTVSKANVTSLYVDVGQWTTLPVSASACVTSFDDTYGSCGATSSSTASGWNSLSLDLSQWTASSHSSWYPYIWGQVPAGGSIIGWLALTP